MQNEDHKKNSIIKRILTVITWPYRKVKEEIAFRKKLKELRKKDPFIYK
mgnify:CR=1 FL=1